MSFPEWVTGQENPEVPVNEGFDILAYAAVYGRDPDTTTGITWGYLGGRWSGFAITGATLTLTNTATNYIVVLRSNGAISVSTSITNWNNTTDYARVYQLTTAGGVVTATQDHRAGDGGIFGAGGSGRGPSSNAAAYNNAAAFTIFGDSFTVGVGASVSTNRFSDLVAAARGWTQTNEGTNGDMVADKAVEVLAKVIGDGSQSLLMLGTNDHRTYTTDINKQFYFSQGYAALLAWLAIPDSRKQKGQDATSETGTWTDTSVYGGALGRQSIVPTSTITLKTYGTVAYVCTLVQNAISATFSVSIDGVAAGTYQCMPGGGATITTINGATFGPALIRIPGLSEGEHTVVITVLTASTANPVYVLWAAGNQGNYTKDGPNVWVSNVPRFTAGGYSVNGGSDATVTAFNKIIRRIVQNLSTDGLNLALADSAARLNTATDLDTDGVHPDDSGHAVIAEAFLEAINQIQKPRTMEAARLVPLIIPLAASDETTAITTGTSKVTFRAPCGFALSDLRASVTTAPTGANLVIDVNVNGSTILSTKLSIDAGEKTSTTAATPAVISSTIIPDDAEITIDFDQVGSSVAGAGVKLSFIGVPL